MSQGAPRVTIVVPTWNTGPLLRICLASVLRHTAPPFQLVVVDNGSSDASRETAEGAAARGLIELVRRDQTGHEGAAAHGAALDAGLAAARAPLLFTLDSDAWVRRAGWLDPWLAAVEAGASHAGATKFPGGALQRWVGWLRGRTPGPEARYVRPCHALYRTEALRAAGRSFAPRQGEDGRWRTTGEALHEGLVAAGGRPGLLPHAEVARRVGHLRHATFVLNAAAFPALRARARRRGERQLRRHLASREVAALLDGTPVP